MPGISFNNRNWPHMTKALRGWSAVTMVTAPPVCLLPAFFSELFPLTWLPFCLQMIVIFLYLAGMFVPLYILGRRYDEKTETTADENKLTDDGVNTNDDMTSTVKNRQIRRGIIFVLAMLLLVFLVTIIGRAVGVTNSGIRVGCVQQYTLQEWSASYRRLDGTMSKTIYPKSGFNAYIIKIETTQGTLSIEMTDIAGNIIFSSEDIQPGTYEVTISGTTRIKITGRNHAGSFSIFSF